MPLATLDNLKTEIGTTETSADALLTTMLVRASSIAEQLAGRPLRRVVDKVEFPNPIHAGTTRLTLSLSPIESVAEVIDLCVSANNAAFDAASIDGDVLTQGDDWFSFQGEIGAANNLGVLQRVWGDWTPGRAIRVTYTAGFVDPADAASIPTGIVTPDDLQDGVIQTAKLLYQNRNTGGTGFSVPGGGQVSGADSLIHPSLRAAAERLRRVSV